jgi:mRNA interferase MazF
MYWCDFSSDAHLPEFYKTRPVVVISHKNTMTGRCIVVPMTTKKPTDKSAIPLSASLDGRESWAVCDHIYTIAASRLHAHHGKIARLAEKELGEILKLAHKQFPTPKNTDGS